jgi:phage terminase large subunit-like protein
MTFDPLMLDGLGYYCGAVESGEFQEGPCIRAMVRRHRTYLEWAREPERFPYAYVPALGQAFAVWCHGLKWVQGAGFHGQPVELLPWERMVSDFFFGWQRLAQDADGAWRPSGRRMVRELGLGVGKGAGKSTWMELMIGYLMACDGAQMADFAVFAVRMNQATDRVRKLSKMLRDSGQMGATWRERHPNPVTVTVEHIPTENKVTPYASIGEEGATDGRRTRLTGVDESASVKDSRRYDELRSGGSATDPNACTIMTTTPGRRCEGWGFERWTYHVTQALLPPKDADPTTAPFMWVLDAESKKIALQALRGGRTLTDGRANWDDPEVKKALRGRDPETAVYDAVRQACPSLTDREGNGGTQIYPNILGDILGAHGRGSTQVAEVCRANLCLWPEAAGMWLNAAAWAEMGRPRADIGLSIGEPRRATWAAYCGSEKRAAALAVYFPDDRYLVTRVYVSREAVEKIDKEQQMPGRWAGWVKAGDVVADGDGVLTFGPMEADVKALHKHHRVAAGVYHEVALGSTMERLKARRQRWKLRRIPATPASYGNGATALIQALAGEADLRHDANPAAHEAVRTVGRDIKESTGAVMPRRVGDHDRIEPAMAIIAAIQVGEALRPAQPGSDRPRRGGHPSMYASRNTAAARGAGGRPARRTA